MGWPVPVAVVVARQGSAAIDDTDRDGRRSSIETAIETARSAKLNKREKSVHALTRVTFSTDEFHLYGRGFTNNETQHVVGE